MHRPTAMRMVTAICVLFGTALGILAPATDASPTNKTFTATLSGINFDAATPSEVIVAITNTAKGPQPFASANITIPSGFSACTTCAGPSSDYDSSGFSESLVSNVVQVRSAVGSGVAPGATIHVHVWASDQTVACTDVSWPVAVKQSNDFSGTGNDFIGPAATPAGYLAFTQQPPSATEFDLNMNPAPQVTSFPACGSGTATASITLSDTAGHLATGSGGPLSSVATFSTVQFTTYDFTDSLVASAAGYPSVTSNSFLVAQKVQPCSSADCPPLSLDSVQKTSGLLVIPTPPANSSLVSGSETGADNSMCGESASGIPDSEISATISVNADAAKTLTFTIAKSLVLAIANNGAPFMSVCLRPPDGSPDITLADCFKGGVTTSPPCVESRNKNQGNEVIVVDLPAGDPHFNVY